jgi:hypothetical protein
MPYRNRPRHVNINCEERVLVSLIGPAPAVDFYAH